LSIGVGRVVVEVADSPESVVPIGELVPSNGMAVGADSSAEEGGVTSFSRAFGEDVVGKADASIGDKTGAAVSSDGCLVWFDIEEGAKVDVSLST
jgi:hypothetical protein